MFWSHIQSEPLLEKGGDRMDYSRDCDLRPGTLHNIWGSFTHMRDTRGGAMDPATKLPTDTSPNARPRRRRNQ